MFLRRAALETLAPVCLLQIYAAQQRAQLFHRDLKLLCTGLSGGDGKRAGLKAASGCERGAPMLPDTAGSVVPLRLL